MWYHVFNQHIDQDFKDTWHLIFEKVRETSTHMRWYSDILLVRMEMNPIFLEGNFAICMKSLKCIYLIIPLFGIYNKITIDV